MKIKTNINLYMFRAKVLAKNNIFDERWVKNFSREIGVREIARAIDCRAEEDIVCNKFDRSKINTSIRLLSLSRLQLKLTAYLA